MYSQVLQKSKPQVCFFLKTFLVTWLVTPGVMLYVCILKHDKTCILQGLDVCTQGQGRGDLNGYMLIFLKVYTPER